MPLHIYGTKLLVIAYLAGRLICNLLATAVYDYADFRSYHFEGGVSEAEIHVHDFTRGTLISGVLDNLYDHAAKSLFSLSIDGDQFYGTDFGSGNAFTGKCETDGLLTIFDAGTSLQYRFAV